VLLTKGADKTFMHSLLGLDLYLKVLPLNTRVYQHTWPSIFVF